MKMLLGLFCGLVCAGSAVLAQEAPQASNVGRIEKVGATGVNRGAEDRWLENVVYLQRGELSLKMDIALPKDDSQAAPCIIAIHGGAWRMGDKKGLHRDIRALAQAGYVAATVQYRFCPEYPFPAQVDDVRAAVRFLKSHAEQYGIDPSRFGAIGFSAGAHLSMMLGVLGKDDLEASDATDSAHSSKVHAVVSYFGPTDLTADEIPPPSIPLIRDFLGAARADALEKFVAASPVTYVDARDAPMLLFQGTNDSLIPTSQAVRMAESLTDAGVEGRVELLIGQRHGWGGELRDYTNRESMAWFDKWLQP